MPKAERKLSFARQATLLLAITASVFVLLIIFFPDEAFRASLQGINVWWKYVFPALLPFFILLELAAGFGVLHGIGSLLDPFMRLFFRLPGTSGWALATGGIGGFPTGAKAAAELRLRGDLTREQGEHLIAMSHYGSPALILIVVAGAFLGEPSLGLLLVTVHYAAGLIIGAFWRRKAPHPQDPRPALGPFAAMKAAHVRDGRTFGKLLGDAVTSSVNGLMIVGGYIVMFAVVLHVITMTRLPDALAAALQAVVPGTAGDLLQAAVRPLLIGLFEPHLGAFAWSEATGLPAMWQAAGIAALLGWGGLSAHAQMRALTQETDLRYGPFLRARLLHSVLAAALTVALWRPYTALGLGASRPSFLHAASDLAAGHGTAYGLWPYMPSMLALLALVLAILGALSLIARIFASK